MNELLPFSSTIQDDSLKLLNQVSTLMRTPIIAFYPLLLLVETLHSILNIRKIDKEKSFYYHERCSKERNLTKIQLRNHVLDVFVENTTRYQCDTDIAKWGALKYNTLKLSKNVVRHDGCHETEES